MARSNTENVGDRLRSVNAKRKLLFVMFVVVFSNFLLRSLARKVRVVTNDVRGRNPHTGFLVAVPLPIMVSVAFLLAHIGAASGIVLGAFIVWDRRSLATYRGRLLWYGFALNFVVVGITLLGYALIEYAKLLR